MHERRVRVANTDVHLTPPSRLPGIDVAAASVRKGSSWPIQDCCAKCPLNMTDPSSFPGYNDDNLAAS